MLGFKPDRLIAVVFLTCVTWGASTAFAQSPAFLSPDVTVVLGTTAETAADEDVAIDGLAGTVTRQSLGALPSNADVSAYTLLAGGDQLIAFDTSVELPGPLAVRRGDVVRFDGATYSLEFDAQAAGVPPTAAVDAVASDAGALLLSFDTSVDLAGVFAADEDVVRWDTTSFVVVFDGSALGLDPAIDLDGVDVAGEGLLWVSLDGHGIVGQQFFADEDVLLVDVAGSRWARGYNGSAQDSSWHAADVDAVFLPEPGGIALIAGVLSLAALAGRRRRAWIAL